MTSTAIETRHVQAHLQHDKTTDVAYVDIIDAPQNKKIDVIDVSEALGLSTTVLGRFDEDGNLLGLTIENYKQFRREVMRKYLALAVEKIIDLLVDRVKNTFSPHSSVRGIEVCPAR